MSFWHLSGTQRWLTFHLYIYVYSGFVVVSVSGCVAFHEERTQPEENFLRAVHICYWQFYFPGAHTRPKRNDTNLQPFSRTFFIYDFYAWVLLCARPTSSSCSCAHKKQKQKSKAWIMYTYVWAPLLTNITYRKNVRSAGHIIMRPNIVFVVEVFAWNSTKFDSIDLFCVVWYGFVYAPPT